MAYKCSVCGRDLEPFLDEAENMAGELYDEFADSEDEAEDWFSLSKMKLKSKYYGMCGYCAAEAYLEEEESHHYDSSGGGDPLDYE